MDDTPINEPEDEVAQRTFRGPVADFVVLSRSRIQRTAFAQPYIVISVSDLDDTDTELPDSPWRRAILRLRFDDVDPQRPSHRQGVAMTDDDARLILDFVRQHLGRHIGQRVEDGRSAVTIVCQCGMGISRSAGIAAALSRLLQGEDAFFFAKFAPNLHVHRTILAAATEPQIDDEVR